MFLSIYCNIFLSFYLNIVCKNIVCELGLNTISQFLLTLKYKMLVGLKIFDLNDLTHFVFTILICALEIFKSGTQVKEPFHIILSLRLNNNNNNQRWL